MGAFGERMRRERDIRGITLESISRTTKIGTHILEALEKEEFDNSLAASSTRDLSGHTPASSEWMRSRYSNNS